ncbi:MAG: nucleoside hydrolase [Candidatus Ventricola sp.]|nr:nucleoside hydrolase [Candidatus Ventricola sp.]
MKVMKVHVPEKKRVRMIVDTDCKNEADDQFALVHHLLTPMFDIRGIIAAHFESKADVYGAGQTVHASMEEIQRVIALLGVPVACPVVLGADRAMTEENVPVPSAGARLIIDEAMRKDERPLYVALLGTATDLASALLMCPEIANRLTAIWIGGGDYPEGGWEFNLVQDIHAANVLLSSRAALWQVPRSTYKQMNVTLSELCWRVAPQGEIGTYLFEQMAELNDRLADDPSFPHGESWCLGDQPTVGLLLEDRGRQNYDMRPAPRVSMDCRYLPGQSGRDIRVYHTLDVRMTLEDFYAKLALHHMKKTMTHQQEGENIHEEV